MPPTENGFCTVSQAAARLGVSRISIWRWIRDGYLPAMRLGPRTTRIKSVDIDQALVQIKTSGSRSWVARRRSAATVVDGPSRLSPLFPGERPDADHAVQFYEHDAILMDAVAEFVCAGLRTGDAAIVVATKSHLEGIAARLRDSGFDVAAALAEGRYAAIDARDTLSRFLFAGTPDAERFAEVVGNLLTQAAKDGRPVRVFGEMVALLAADGNYAAAVRLEELWNNLQRTRRFSLLCAYPIGQLGADTLSDVLGEVCSAYTQVIPGESYSRLRSDNDRVQAIVALQQQTRWLQTQLEARHHAEVGLRQALTAQHDARQEELVAQRKRDELISVAAQELKHPLYSLSLQAQHALVRLGRETMLEPEQIETAVEAIAGQPAEIPRLIGQLVTFSQLDARRLTLQPRLTNLVGLVETVLADLGARNPQHAITLSAPVSLEIWLDPERTADVLESLVSNAVKFGAARGPIDIRLSTSDSGSVEVSVRDRGEGIAPEKRETLFERSHDTDESDARSGLKLSLFLSRQIVELHGGELYAEFPPDGGTQFVMSLPSRREESTVRVAAD